MSMTKKQALEWAKQSGPPSSYNNIRQVNEQSRKTAFRHRAKWTPGELRVAAQWEGTDIELSEKLSRTVLSVRQCRNVIRFCQRNNSTYNQKET